MGFRLFAAATMKIAVFRNVAPCSLVEVNRRFVGVTDSTVKAMKTHRCDVGNSKQPPKRR
jgi:hypothetical protein